MTLNNYLCFINIPDLNKYYFQNALSQLSALDSNVSSQPPEKVYEVALDNVNKEPSKQIVNNCENPLEEGSAVNQDYPGDLDSPVSQTILEKCEETYPIVHGADSDPDKLGAGLEAQRTLDDRDYFKAIPVVVRQPIRLPRHAAHIFNSRLDKPLERFRSHLTGLLIMKSKLYSLYPIPSPHYNKK